MLNGFAIFWNENGDNFSSEFKVNALSLSNWFEAKIKNDAHKMSNVSLREFEDGIMISEFAIKKHTVIHCAKNNIVTNYIFS